MMEVVENVLFTLTVGVLTQTAKFFCFLYYSNVVILYYLYENYPLNAQVAKPHQFKKK